MGDRCYMHVTCLRQDQSKFEELGFALDFEESGESPVVELVDTEANYAHHSKLPPVPFIAWHEGGGEYGPGRVVCDGKQMSDVPATRDGFVVIWDYEKQRPRAQCLKTIRRHLTIHDRVQEMFNQLTGQSPHKHLFSTGSQRCFYCGIHFEEVQLQPCNPIT